MRGIIAAASAILLAGSTVAYAQTSIPAASSGSTSIDTNTASGTSAPSNALLSNVDVERALEMAGFTNVRSIEKTEDGHLATATMLGQTVRVEISHDGSITPVVDDDD